MFHHGTRLLEAGLLVRPSGKPLVQTLVIKSQCERELLRCRKAYDMLGIGRRCRVLSTWKAETSQEASSSRKFVIAYDEHAYTAGSNR